MDEEQKMLCERGCTWERTSMTATPDAGWHTEGCPACGGKYAGQIFPAPKVA
jgi:hypothetical protein